MRVRTMRELGGAVRHARRQRHMTQAELAERMGVSRDWVVRLERGHARLEAQKVFDALFVVGLAVDVSEAPAPEQAGPDSADPFAEGMWPA